MSKKGYDIKLVTKWAPPEDGDLRALIAMPNIPKPTHGLAPRTLLGATTWNHMRKYAYTKANDTCEICGTKPEDLHRRHGHEVYEIDYETGTVKFVRVFCICSLCHLGGIHTGRAVTLHRQGNLLYPKEFLLEGAENSFRLISEYNKDHPGADLRAWSTYLSYLECDDLREDMEGLIEKYNIKFYENDPAKTARWGQWKLIIGDQEYPTPYKNERDWKRAMEEASKNDTARIAQRNLEEKFSGGVYDELNKYIKGIDISTKQ